MHIPQFTGFNKYTKLFETNSWERESALNIELHMGPCFACPFAYYSVYTAICLFASVFCVWGCAFLCVYDKSTDNPLDEASTRHTTATMNNVAGNTFIAFQYIRVKSIDACRPNNMKMPKSSY